MSAGEGVTGAVRGASWRPTHATQMLVFVAAGISAVASAAGADVRATVVGGADPSGHVYTWRIGHEHTSPLVGVEFPHYMADVFTAPEGWAVECTHLIGQGGRPARGVCVARVETDGRGLPAGREAEFTMRIAPAGTPRGTGSVKLSFADGTTLTVGGVEVPIPTPVSDRLIVPAGLAAILIIIVAVGARKRRRRASAGGV